MSSVTPNVNRTVICSIVFVDIVEYSKKTVSKQLAMKGWFNDMLSAALQHVAETDRIILDTGDGAALCFPGDPEDALFVTNNLKVAIAEHAYPEFALRVGVNLGPVKIVTDINGRPNILGDGINVAQRVMSFANPNQILVSRSYYEVVSCLSDGYAQLFRYGGVHQDKHVREHEVYEVAVSGASAETLPIELATLPATTGIEVTETLSDAVFEEPFLNALTRRLTDHIGPIAPVIVKRFAKRSMDAQALVRAVANVIPEPAHRQAFLEHALTMLGSEAPASDAPPTVQTADSASPAIGNSAGVDFDPEWIARVEAVLARHIGPIARIIVKKAVKTAASRAAFVAQLSASIEKENDRAAFSATVEKLKT